MTDQLDLEGLADEAAKLEWTITKYHDVEGPDGRTVELNGFASVMAGGERQRWSRARTKLVVDVLAAFPGAIAALRASEAECERLKVENVNLRIAFDMADESRETFFRQAKAAEAKITAQAETISELVRALKDAKSYGNLYYRQRLPNQNEAYCDAVDRINALIAKTAPDTGEQSQ